MPDDVKPRAYRSPRRAEGAARTRERIVSAARDLLRDKGYAGTTVTEVARAAGVSVDTLYTSVGRKPQLVLAVVDDILGEGQGAVPAAQRAYVARGPGRRGSAGEGGRVRLRDGPSAARDRSAAAGAGVRRRGGCRLRRGVPPHRRAAGRQHAAARGRPPGDRGGPSPTWTTPPSRTWSGRRTRGSTSTSSGDAGSPPAGMRPTSPTCGSGRWPPTRRIPSSATEATETRVTRRPGFATLADRGTRRHRRGVLLAPRRPAAAARRLAAGRRGRQDRADRAERHRQDHPDPDHRRRPGARRRRHHPQRRARRDAPVRRPAPRRLDRARPAAHGRAGQGPQGRGGGRRHRAADDGARHRGGPAGLRAGPRRLGRRRRLRVRDAVGHLHRRRARHPLREGAVAPGHHAVRWRAEAARPRGAAPRTRGRPAPRRAGQLPRRPRQALARGPARRLAEDGAVRLARPRAAEPGRHPDRHPRAGGRGRHALGAPGPVHDLRATPAGTGTTASRSCAAAGTRSTPSSRRWW